VDVIGLLALSVALATAAVAGARLRLRLPPDGLLAEVVAVNVLAARLLAVGCAVLATAAIVPVPPSLAPFAGLGVALAVGWSVRDLLPDVVGWVALLGQHRVRRGRHVRGADFDGRVERVGLLSTTLAARRGERLAVPNRRFVGQSITVLDSPFAPVEVPVVLPGVPAAEARRALRAAVFLSPWLAPDPSPEVNADPGTPDGWRVRVTLVEPRFAEPFCGSFLERVQEVLVPGSTPTPPGE
jgi:small-conductance mechanosensitive channel